MVKSSLRLAKRLLFIAILILIAFEVRLFLHPYLGDRFPYVTFIIAASFIAFNLNTIAAVASLIIGIPISAYFFLFPYDSFEVANTYMIYYLALKFLVGVLIVTFIGWIKFGSNTFSENH